MQIRRVMTLCVACIVQGQTAFAADSPGANLNEDIDSVGLSLILPFGGNRSGEHWLDRAETSLDLRMNGYQPSYWAPCEESCQQRPFMPQTYSLSITGLVEAAGMLVGPDKDLRLQLGRWRDLLVDTDLPAPQDTGR